MKGIYFLVVVGTWSVEGDKIGLQPFFDYDCDLVHTLDTAAFDWNTIYRWVEVTVLQGNESSFYFPSEYSPVVAGPLAATAEEECPLGVLYLTVLNFYDALSKGEDNDSVLAIANRIQRMLQKFPVYAIALSRWPVFYAFDHFADVHAPQREWFCDGVVGVVDWDEMRSTAVHWADLKKNHVEEVDTSPLEYMMSDRFLTMLRKPANQDQSQEECEFGFYFLIANQVVAAANRETQYLPPFNSIIDVVLTEKSFITIAASGWPIFTVLVILSDLNKGAWFFGGDRKYLRGYSDWDLRRDELSPLIPSSLDFLTPQWKQAVSESVETLVKLEAGDFAKEVLNQAERRKQDDGQPRAIVQRLVDAALEVAASENLPGAVQTAQDHHPRLVYVVLLYGEAWARLLVRLAQRLHRQLRVPHPLFVIAIGEDAAESCKNLSDERRNEPSMPAVICWTPHSQSQVHRFTAIHALIHLGIDIIYVDMDTFMVQDPTPRILTSAVGFDALFARHADADCVNIGVFYLRASARTAVWLSQFLTWYHDHPFEIDQRGLHVFLGLPAKQMKVAYPPEDLVSVQGDVLEDVNEVVIGDVGWHGNLSRLLIFHWCHRPIYQKEEEITAAYDAGDVAAIHGLPLSLALEAVHSAPRQAAWVKVLRLRAIFEVYRKDAPPERIPCW